MPNSDLPFFFLKPFLVAKATLLALALALPAHAVDFANSVQAGKNLDVVALVRNESETSGGLYRIFCSGVVVHPRVVLTAAHCLQNGALRPDTKVLKQISRSLRVHIGEGDSSGDVSQSLVEVQRIALHPSYQRGIRGWSDLAILILKKEAPVPKEQIRPLALDFEILKREMTPFHFLTVTGFGFSEDIHTGSESFGIKRSGEIRIEGKTASEILIVGGRPQSGSEKMQAPRDGDSGGPVFHRNHDGRESLAGVVSRATKHNNGNYGTALSLIRPSVCWIESETGLKFRPPSEVDYCKMEVPLHKPNALHETDFKALCLNSRNLKTSARYTLSILMKKLEETDCARLESKVLDLTNLNLDATFITDVSPLAALTKLERLSIRDNGILSVSPLKALHQLRYLDLSYNNIKDSQSLSDPRTRGLQVIGEDRQKNNITRTEFLKICLDPKSTPAARATVSAILAMFELQNQDCINANYELIRLRSLDFYQVEGLTDMSPLRGLPTLEALDLTGQKVQNLEFISSLKNLRTLIVDGNPVQSLKPLLSLPYLRELSIKETSMKDISLLQNSLRLKRLNVSGNRIQDFSALTGLERRGLQITGKDNQIP